MATDKEFLLWLHQRLCNVHKENELYGYMYRFRSIIAKIPEDQVTPNDIKLTYNDLISGK